MGRTDRSKEASRNAFDGTSARTRPLSFEEIMSRRKKKLAVDAKETTNELRESDGKNDAVRASDHVDTQVDDKKMKDLRDKIKERFRKKEEIVSKSERDKFEGKDKDLNGRSRNSKSSRDKDSKNEKQTHDSSRMVGRSGTDLQKKSEKKPSKDTTERDYKHEDREWKYKREGKRKHHSHTDENNRAETDGSIFKKRDSAKLREKEYSERYCRKKEYSQPYREELRSKRRRSRSHEDRERERRSLSLSPSAHKRPHHGRDYEQSPPQSYREKSRRKYSDLDKYKTSGNGGYASGHYRKQGSGLGGYSPRKRKTEAAVKTPSPTHRSPERKVATWDQPPAGTSNAGSGSGSGSMLTNFHSPATKLNELASSLPLSFTTTKSQPTPSLGIAPAVVKASIDSVQLTEATRPRRRLYVENLPPSASDKAVVDCLNDFLLSSGINHIQGTKPCISCIMNKEKYQALVEFLTPEDATSALSFDGRSLCGSVLKIRRPKDFVETASGTLDKPVAVDKAIADVVKDSPRKIFVAGISKALSSDMLLEIVGAFGVLKAFHFEFNEEFNGSCAFLEYVDHSVTQKACAGLNGMKLGGSFLTVVQATPDAHGEEEDSGIAPSYDIPMHAKPLLEDPTQVLQLKDMFTQEEFSSLSEPELDETLEDIRLECARFGTIKSVNVVRYETVATAIKQYPYSDSTKTEPAEVTPDGDTNKISELLPNDIKGSRDGREVLEDGNINGEQLMEDHEERASQKNLQSPSPTVHEEPPQHGDLSADSSKGLEITEECCSVENDLLPETSSVMDVTVDNLEGGSSLNTSIKDEADACTGDGDKGLLENVDMNIVVPDKTNGDGDGACQSYDLDQFEPGCILVEFLRKEASCMAAHCLHGRVYGDKVVKVGYVQHDLYRARFLS